MNAYKYPLSSLYSEPHTLHRSIASVTFTVESFVWRAVRFQSGDLCTAIRASISFKSHTLHRSIASVTFTVESFVWRAVRFQSGDLCTAIRATVSAAWWSARIMGAIITRWRGPANWRAPNISKIERALGRCYKIYRLRLAY